MDPGMLHGLTFLRGNPPLFVGAIQNVQVQPKLTVSVTSGKCKNTSWTSILAPTYRCFGFAIAFTIILIGIIVNQTASFLTSTRTSLLSWKLNLGIPFAPGSKFGLYMSLWCEEFLDRIGATQPVKSPPATIPRSSSPNPYITLHDSPRYNPNSSGSISSGSEN